MVEKKPVSGTGAEVEMPLLRFLVRLRAGRYDDLRGLDRKTLDGIYKEAERICAYPGMSFADMLRAQRVMIRIEGMRYGGSAKPGAKARRRGGSAKPRARERAAADVDATFRKYGFKGFRDALNSTRGRKWGRRP